jgi:hypothetical protein
METEVKRERTVTQESSNTEISSLYSEETYGSYENQWSPAIHLLLQQPKVIGPKSISEIILDLCVKC